MASIDATVVGIALPRIGRQFHTGVSELQWVSNAYTLALAGLLLLGGALGDRLGRRRMFRVGTAWFAVSSLLCGVAPSALLLVGARALQGVGAALLTPGSLAILGASFGDDDRNRAIGAWSGLSGVATAIGPFLGGWLIGAASWRFIFFINLPVAAVVLAVSARHVPESRDRSDHGPLDFGGAVLVSAGLLGVVFGLTQGAALGWSSVGTLATLGVGAGCLAGFAALERLTRYPLVPLEMFRSAQFSGTNAVTFLVYGGLGGALFLLPVELQDALHYSPLAAGTALLPVTMLMLALSSRSGALATRLGPRMQMSVGPLLAGGGLALLGRVGPGSTYLSDVLPAAGVLGLGLAVTVAPLTATAMGSARPEHSGVASAVNNDVARAAGLLAVAALPAASGIRGRAYLFPAQLTSGFHTAIVISALSCAVGGVTALLTIRNPSQPAQPCWTCGLDAPTPVASS